MEESNKKGKTWDLFHQVQQTKEKFKARIGVLKRQHGNALTRRDEIERRWKEYGRMI